MPQDDLFQVITEHEPGTVRPTSYLGIECSDDLTQIQLTVSDTRTVDLECSVQRVRGLK